MTYKPRRIQYLINHWSDTKPQATVEDIRAMHKAKGWRDIGYHRVILHPLSAEFFDSEGRRHQPQKWSDLVKLGRELDDDLYIEANEIGAQCYGYNEFSVGICTIGMPGVPLHPLQKEAIIQVNKTMLDRFQLRPGEAIKGHRDCYPTQCPGDEIYAVVKALRAGVL